MGRPRVPPHLHTRVIMLDYFAFKAEQRRLWIARVRHAAKVNPDLSWERLAERFNCEPHQVYRVCQDLPREPDLFAAAWNRANRRKSA